VDEVSDIAGFVLPHTRVDVLVSVTGDTATGGKTMSKTVLQNVEVLAVAQEIEKTKDEPQVVKVVTLLVSPQEAERLALASREGSLRLAMRNYNDNKIVLTSGVDTAQMLRAYSLAPDVPVMPSQPAGHVIAAPRRAKPIEIEILRNGKSSESVSFVNEGGGSSETKKHHPRAAASDADDHAASGSSSAVASAPDAAPHEVPAAPMSGELNRAGVPASASALGYLPTPKTIDIP
jgi:hypothetical protein